MTDYMAEIRSRIKDGGLLINWNLPVDMKRNLIRERDSGRMNAFRKCYCGCVELSPEAVEELESFLALWGSPLMKALR